MEHGWRLATDRNGFHVEWRREGDRVAVKDKSGKISMVSAETFSDDYFAESLGMARLGRLVEADRAGKFEESDPAYGSDPGTASAHAGMGHYPTGWGYAAKKGASDVRVRYRLTAPGTVEVWDRRSGQSEKDAVKMSFKDFDREWRAL